MKDRDLEKYWKGKEKLINKAMSSYLRSNDRFSQELLRLMRYSVLAGGKRIRSILILTAAEMLDRDWRRFIPAACAIEMIHASSLILDDLPCMDDALTRRGKPSLHRVGGEANAILASYALLMEGVKLIAKNARYFKIDSPQFCQIVESISDAIGLKGISLGQFLDLNLTGKKCSRIEIERIHFYKTASLFSSCLEIAAILAKAKKKQILALKEYGRNLGLSFQIRDDLLDREKKSKDLGKSSLKGELRPNYANFVGRKKANERLHYLVNQALFSLRIFGNKAGLLRRITSFVEDRGK